MSALITLTTDFGLQDGYVGTMKGVILGINPQATIVDLCHDIAPQDVREAAYVLYTAYHHFPPRTVHVVVVDPGVGSERRAIALRTRQAVFVAPDNGVLSYVVAQAEILGIVHLTNPRYWLAEVSATFHGRDIFAPVAGHLSRGVPFSELGQPIHDIVLLPLPQPKARPDGTLIGHILHVDRFGNCITDVRAERLPTEGPLTVEVAGRRIVGLSPTYASGEEGEFVTLIGSEGHLEIAVRGGSAAQALGARAGDEIVVRPG
jgi:S-adenosylmethionine hydrolase